MSRLGKESALSRTFIQPETELIVQRERERSQRLQNPGKMHWKLATSLVIKSIRSKKHYQANLSVTQVEHMSEVDCFDGETVRRKWGASPPEGTADGGADSHATDEEDLLQIYPVLDGRLKDIARV